ncbi:carboxypeptidase-like regulatory domain-containing protein [Glaciihabitans sp. dw_435]|uniref:carboxypeptidase-like regulatory domain-containing protein n=1 Tax=Glaciihabitans sp. dw_435 TaxID=2720081 RepID=UPI001BD595B2|nr:carboxypeptidase-like regulatory domain-containing protein [Glaciihabitans sp. dw_435]
MKNRVIAIVIASVVALGLGVAPAAASTSKSSTATGTVVVQLLTPAGNKFLPTDDTQISLWKKQGGGYGAFAFASAEKHSKADSTTAGGGHRVVSIVNGRAVFKVPAGLAFYPKAWSSELYLHANAFTKRTVAAGKTLTINIVIPRGGSISGKLMNTSGRALAGVKVVAYDSKGRVQDTTKTDGAGHYLLAALPTDNKYRVQFNPRVVAHSPKFNSGYVTGFYKNAPYWAKAKVIAVHQQSAKRSASVIQGANSMLAARPK